MRLILLFLGCLTALASDTLDLRIENLIKASETARRAQWGIEVINLRDRAVVFQLNPEALFTPASNIKLFSTALALQRLGPDYRFVTTVRSATAPHASGILPCDLVLVGGGDPTISGRIYPYQKAQGPPDSWKGINQLADQIVARGIRRIVGNVVGDDTRYPWKPYGEGWAVDDTQWAYGAPVSALSTTDNTQTLLIEPGVREGGIARLALRPDVEYFLIDNRVKTVLAGESRISVRRRPGSRQVRLDGEILLRGKPTQEPLAVDDAAEFTAQMLYTALRVRGVAISGRPVARHRLTSQEAQRQDLEPVELAKRESPPLLAVLQLIDKISQNLHAEIVLRETGFILRGAGTVDAGLEELKSLLSEAGIKEGLYGIEDGSGLGRGNQISPRAVNGLLAFMHSSINREQWISLLPVGGEDGTLETRFGGNTQANLIRAKTGALARASALSGYAFRTDGRVYGFSILVNGYLPGEGSEIRKIIDKIGLALLE